MKTKSAGLIASIALLGVGLSVGSASATVIPVGCSPCEYALTFSDGSGDSANLDLFTHGPATSSGVLVYDVTGSAVFGGSSYNVTGPDPTVEGPSGNGLVDDLLYSAPPYFDQQGIGLDFTPALFLDPPYIFNLIGVCPSGCADFTPGTFNLGPATQATPLPPAWTMMLLGLGMLGFVACRRARADAVSLMAA